MRISLVIAIGLVATLFMNAAAIGSAPTSSKNASPQLVEKPNLTFEKYGPQARARAVRASLKTALAPDPLSMGALLFCAFSLRWMRMRKELPRRAEHQALPGAA